ncbi:MAG: C25 family cysteine peptidase, partial [Planctomycetota bacterium]
DGDLVPDIPVGRIPARTAKQLKLVVDKILAFENRIPTPSDLCMPIWAGSSGYNPMLDSMATYLLLGIVEKHASSWVEPWIISADPKHPLCGWPPDQGEVFAGRFSKGGFLAAFLGHGTVRSFHSMYFNGKSIDYTGFDAKAGLAAGRPGPATVILACDTGRFIERENCLAESLLFLPGGPVAVAAATTESHPLTNYFSGVALVQQSRTKSKRLGSIWLTAQKQAMQARDIIMERMLVDVEGKLEEKMNVAKLRRDQILMYALLGDPATQLNFPEKLDAEVKYSGGAWRWDARKPEGAGRLYVTLQRPAQDLRPRTAQVDKDTAHRLFKEANDSFAFKAVGELTSGVPWKGAISEQGTLRLIAAGPGQIHVAAFELTPTDATARPQ